MKQRDERTRRYLGIPTLTIGRGAGSQVTLSQHATVRNKRGNLHNKNGWETEISGKGKEWIDMFPHDNITLETQVEALARLFRTNTIIMVQMAEGGMTMMYTRWRPP